MSKHATLSTTQDAQRERVLVAVAAIQEAKGALSISQAAKQYDVPKITLSDQL